MLNVIGDERNASMSLVWGVVSTTASTRPMFIGDLGPTGKRSILVPCLSGIGIYIAVSYEEITRFPTVPIDRTPMRKVA